MKSRNAFEHSFDAVDDLLVPEAQHSIASVFKIGGAPSSAASLYPRHAELPSSSTINRASRQKKSPKYGSTGWLR